MSASAQSYWTIERASSRRSLTPYERCANSLIPARGCCKKSSVATARSRTVRHSFPRLCLWSRNYIDSEALSKSATPANLVTHVLADDQLAPQNHKAKEHARQWNLCDYESGLATELKACFEGGKRTSEEYEDLIERCLFRFGGANKRAMLGPGKLDTHPAYKAYKQNWSKRRAVDGRGDT